MNINSSFSGLPNFSAGYRHDPDPKLLAELEKLSELDEKAFSTDKSLDKNIFAVQMLDPLIGETIYEGSDPGLVTEHFIKILKSIQKQPYGKSLKDIIPLFEECLSMDKEISKLVIERKYTEKPDFTPLKDLAKKFEKKAKDLEIGQRLLVPGGWITNNYGGHAMLYCIERESDTTFKFLIFNAGMGVDHHAGYVDSELQNHHEGFVEINDISIENMSDRIFQAIIEMQSLPKSFHEDPKPSEAMIYNSIVVALKGKAAPSLDPTKHFALYNKEQRSGVCSFKSRLLALRYLILQESLKKPEKQEDLFKTYKMIRFAHKKAVLIEVCQSFFAKTTDWDPNTHKIISHSCRLIARMSKKFVNQGIISADDLKKTLATLTDVRSRLNNKKHDHEMSLKKTTLEFKAELGAQALPDGEWVFNNGVRGTRDDDFNQDRDGYNRIELLNLSLPKLPDKLTAENVVSYLKNWGQFDIQTLMRLVWRGQSNFSEVLTSALRHLPIPKKNDKNGFWDQIPEKDIEVCLKALSKITKISMFDKKEYSGNLFTITTSNFIEIQSALAIAETLARRKSEYLLDGYQLPHQQLVRFATNPDVVITNPADQIRLDELLAYFAPEVDLRYTQTPQNNPERELFAIHTQEFKIDQEAVEKIQEWKYYSQFLWKPSIILNLMRHLKLYKPQHEKIAHLATHSTESSNLLPKGVVYLRNLSLMCQFADPTQQRALYDPYQRDLNNYRKKWEFNIQPLESLNSSYNGTLFGHHYHFPNKEMRYLRPQDVLIDYKFLTTFDLSVGSREQKSYSKNAYKKNEHLLQKQQNEIMAQTVDEFKRDKKIIFVNKDDQLTRLLTYLQTLPNQDVLIKSDRLEIFNTLFQSGCLLRQIEKEPRVAAKLMAYLNQRLDYFLYIKDMDNCLFYVEIASHCAEFIQAARERKPDIFEDVQISILNYRNFLLEEVIPQLKGILNSEQYTSIAHKILISVYESKQNLLSPDDKVSMVVDWFCSEGHIPKSYETLIDWDSALRHQQRDDWRQVLSVKCKAVLQDDTQSRDQIFNQILLRAKRKVNDQKWKGSFPIFRAGPFRIDFNKMAILVDETEEALLPQEIEKKCRPIVGCIDKVRLKDGIYHFVGFSEDEKYEIKVYEDKSFDLYRIINNQKYTYGCIKGDFKGLYEFNKNYHSWLLENDGDECLVMNGKTIMFYGDFDKKGKLLCVSDKQDRSRQLVSPWHIGSYKEVFNQLTKESNILCWATKENPKTLDSIEIPSLNLNFKVTQEKSGKVRLYSQEMSGYFIAEDQLREFSDKWPSYIVLQNEKGDRKVIMRELVYNKGVIKTTFAPEIPQTTTDNLFLYNLGEICGKLRLIPNNTKDALHLILINCLTGHFEQAINLIPFGYSLSDYSEDEKNYIVYIIDGQLGGNQPKAIVCRLKLAAMLLENSIKYTSNDEKFRFQSDYVLYLNNLKNTPETILTPDEEIMIMNSMELSNSFILRKEYLKRRKISVDGRLGVSLLGMFLMGGSVFITRNDLEILLNDRLFPNTLGTCLFTEQENQDVKNNQSYSGMYIEMYKIAQEGTEKQKNDLQQQLLMAVSQLDNPKTKKWYLLILAIIKNRVQLPTWKEIEKLKSLKFDTIEYNWKLDELAILFSSCASSIGISEVPFRREPINKMELNIQQLPQIKKKVDLMSVPTTLLMHESDWDKTFAELHQSFQKEEKSLKSHILNLLAQTRLAIKKQEKSIFALANQLKPKASVEELIDHEAKTSLKLTLNDVVVLFEAGDLNKYRGKTKLCDEQIKQLDSQVGELMVYSTRAAQLIRTIDLLNEKETSLEQDLLDKKISNELTTKRPYAFTIEKSDLKRTYLVFEYRNGLIMRDKQKAKLEIVENLNGSVPMSLELGTGIGKTKFIAPLMQSLRRRINKLILNVWPSALYQVNKTDIQGQVVKSFNQRSDTFEFTRQTPVDEKNLKFIRDQLLLAISEGRQINTTPESLQSAELKFFEVLNKTFTSNIVIELFQDILNLLGDSEAHIDESHINLSPKREVNFTIGNPEYESLQHIELIAEMFSFLTQGKVNDIMKLSEDKQRFVSKDQFDKEVVPQLAAHMAEKLKVSDKKAFMDYVLGGEVQGWVKNHPKRELIALVRGHLTSLFYDFFQKSVNVNFGLSHENHNALYAKPYLGNDCPNEKADYELIYEAIDKTYLTYLYQGIKKDELWNLILVLQKEAIKQSKKTMPRINTRDTEAYKFFEENFPNKGSLFGITKDALSEFTEVPNKNPELIIQYVTKLVAPNIKKYSEKLKSTSQNARSIIKNFIAMSATPGNPDSYSSMIFSSLDPESAKTVLNTIKAKCSAKETIHVTKASQPKDVLSEILPLLKNSFRMLIDIGALFKGISNKQIADQLLNHFKLSNPEIQGVVYFDDKNKLMIIESGKENPIPFEQSTLTPHQRFTYCDQRHSFGADIRQFSSAKGLATFDTITTTDEVLQGVGRMRQFLEGQSVEWVLTPDAQKLLLKDKKEALTIDHLLKHAQNTQQRINQDLLYSAIRQQMDNEIRTTLKDILIKPRHDASITRDFWSAFNKYIIDECESTPFLQFGQNEKFRHAADILLDYRKKLSGKVDNMKDLNKDLNSVLEDLKKRLLSYDKIIEKLRVQLPQSVSTHANEIGVSVETQIDSETSNEIKAEVNTETQKQTQVNLENLMWGRNILPTLWPRNFNFYDQDWLKAQGNIDLNKIEFDTFHNEIPKPVPKVSAPPKSSLAKRLFKIIGLTVFSGALAFPVTSGIVYLSLFAAKISAVAIPIIALVPPLQVAFVIGASVALIVALTVGIVKIVQLIKQRRIEAKIESERLLKEQQEREQQPPKFNDKPMPVFELSDLINICKLPNPKELYNTQTGEILFTNNFIRLAPEIRTIPLSEDQKSLYEVLLVLDEDDKGKKKWTVVMGDQSTDAAFWRKELETIKPEEALMHKRRVCLYDLVSGIVQDSPNKMSEKEINEDQELQRMLTMVKLYNGDVFYSELQEGFLRKLSSEGLEEAKALSKKARVWHEVKQSQYAISNAADIFEEIIVKTA